MTAKSATELTLQRIDNNGATTYNNVVLGFKKFPFENEEVVVSPRSLSPQSKYIPSNFWHFVISKAGKRANFIKFDVPSQCIYLQYLL